MHPPPAKGLHQFHHLLEGDSRERISGHDLPVLAEAWHEGDWLVVWADLELPPGPGPYWVMVGMYTWPDLVRSGIVERPDDPLPAIRLGPVALDR